MEEWRDIKGFEDSYQVSSYGRVRTKDRYLKASHGSRQFRKGQMIKSSTMPNGYLCVGLWKNNKSHVRYIHRLVAEHFIPNTADFSEVNHKDENKDNNRVSNLEWCDHRHNMNYGTIKERISVAHKNRIRTTRVLQIKDDVVIATFNTAAEAERQTGIDASAIRKVCLSRPKFITAGGYKWIEQETLTLF